MTATAASVAATLAGHQVKAKGKNYLVQCPVHDDQNPSLSIRDGDKGLIVHCFAGCDARDVLGAIRARVGNTEPIAVAPEPAKGSRDYERDQHDKARWLWSQRRPITGTIAEKYLREARGITHPLPPTLAFLPPRKPQHHPAMIAAFGLCNEVEPGVIVAPRDVVAVHLTLLRPDGSDKTEVEKPKLIIASPSSTPIIVAPMTDLLGLAICEGIEDALSAHEATGLGAWAAGAAGFMPGLADALPDFIEALTIYAHADKAGQNGARGLAAKLRARGIEVVVEGLDA